MKKPFLLILALWTSALFAQNATTFSLVAEHDTFRPGDTLWIAQRFEMRPHWHIYWINPGDSGMPPSIQWQLPPGFSVGETLWPTPKRLVVEGLVSFGYEGEALLLVPLQTPADLAPGERVTLRASADWLECEDICVPGRGRAEITLTASAQAPAGTNPRFEAARRALPGGPVVGSRQGDSLRVPLTGEWSPPFQFFPAQEGAWVLEPAPAVAREGDTVLIRAVRNPTGGVAAPEMRGVLADAAGRAVWVAEGAASAAAPLTARGSLGLVLLAFVAGILLNLMPCIFPVLGLKISSFIEQGHGAPGAVRAHAWVFASGILLSMWILGAAVSVLGGIWGAQFQDTRVVIALLLVLTLFTMNLFGVFEMGHALTTLGGGLTQKQGYAGSFFQGVLLTIIGTPCTGPVMAAVIGPLLTQPPLVVFSAFTLMGLGLALPYVLLAYLPALIDRLPPPGMWMVTFKQGSAFLMVLFLWGLIYVLHRLEPDALPIVLAALLVVCFASWVLGTWGAPERPARVRTVARICTLLLLVAAALLAYSYHKPAASLDASLRARIDAGEPLRWSELEPTLAEELLARGVPLHYRPFSPALLDELRAAGTPVFVDFTADWCTQCKVNKLTTLHRDEVMRAFTEAGVVTLRADLTRRDDALTAIIASHNRRGLPVYLFYPAGASEPTFLPEKLSPAIVREALRAAGSK